MSTCKFQECVNPSIARGLCAAHYRQFRLGQELRPVRYVRQPVAARFWPKVDRQGPDDCWRWLASTDGKGYGQITIDGKRRKAHRVAYELEVGPIPNGLSLDHLCRHTWCVNPAHLEPTTHGENVRRGSSGLKSHLRALRQTHCKSGHEFTQENTRIDKRGRRVCRACQNQWQQEYQRRRARKTEP